jgi:tetratricopeptide (TPR) repeat protein
VKRSILLPILLLLAGHAAAAQRVEAIMSSRFLVRGEQAMLDLVLSGSDYPSEVRAPEIPAVKDVDIRSISLSLQQRRDGNGRRREFYVPFAVASYTVGTHVIPPIEVSVDGETHRTQPVTFRVLDEKELKWSHAVVSGQRISYSATFHALKTDPYVGEKQPVELKVYFPADQFVLDWGIPDFQRDGVSAWRFQPQPRLSQATLRAQRFYAVPYPSTASTLKEGNALLGPATVDLQLRLTSIQEFNRAYNEPVKLEIPALALESKPLPEGAPEGFDNAIGKFKLEVITGEKDVHEGDPVTVEMKITGSGNLDAINPPKPVDGEGWKLYDASSEERGEERRELAGEVIFRQFMKPLNRQRAIPPFRLVYFDPEAEEYVTLQSDAIPLNLLPSTATGLLPGPPPALAMPLEEMTDILGVVNANAGLVSGTWRKIPAWFWQLLPALVALFLIFRIGMRHLAPRLKKDPQVLARRREWREVESAPDQLGGFYRKAGHFIERWLGDRQDPVIAEVLKRRDEVCFRREEAEARIDRSERHRVLKQLRRIAVPLVAAMAVLGSPDARAAEMPGALYESGRYAEAAKAWLESGPYEKLSADTLYNIGNSAYRLGSAGEAALYYRRALERDPSHAESRQNLRFLERKFGSITIKRPDYQYQIARLPLRFWQGLVWASAWAVALGLLVFPATRPGAGVRVAAVTAWVVAPLAAACGILGWRFYPDDARFAPAAEQAVVVADTAPIRTDAARTAPKVIDAPAGSLCRLITRSGDWAYVAFTNESRGWVPLVDIRPLVPETTPEVPKARALSDSENNA